MLCGALVLGASGCENFLTNFAAGSSARIFARAAPAIQRFSDPDLAEQGLPGSLTTLEGLMSLLTDNVQLHEVTARSYASLGFGFLEDHMEEYEARGDQDMADHYRARASAAYLRSRSIGFEMMSIWEPDDNGVEGHRMQLERWRPYLQHFDRAEQGPMLFWTAYAWARWIGLNTNDVNAVADLPFVTALAERARALSPDYENYSPRALAAGLAASIPAQLGGHPEVAAREFEELIRLTGGRNLMLLLFRARVVAVAMQDRRAFRENLQRVLDAGDVEPNLRLQNQIARRRARRYLDRIEEFFIPEGDAPAASGGDAPAPAAETPAQPAATP